MSVSSVEKEFEKNPKLKANDVEQLRAWIDKQHHLPSITDFQLILFLQSCYFSLEAAKFAIETYYSLKTHCTEIFAPRSATTVKKFLQILCIVPLPRLSPKKDKIIFYKFTDWDVNDFVFAEAIKNIDMNIQLMLMQEGTAEGHILLIDLNGMQFGHVTKIKPSLLKPYFIFLQDAAPIRLKAFHMINAPPFMDTLLALIKPFMGSDLINKLHIHPTMDQVYEFIPKDCFPKDYGGEIDCIQNLHEKSMENVLGNLDFFELEDKKLVNECKRAGKPILNPEQLFGLDGSFKKLDID